MKLILIASLFFSLLQGLSASEQKIVRGVAPESNHPALFNTVALVKEDGTIYCTGSIVASNLIVTAKHCLMDREIKDINIFFGESTHEEGVKIPAHSYAVRHPKDWTMMFPSFDIAWVKISETLPKGYRPLPVLSDRRLLKEGMDIYQAGFGNHSAIPGKIEAGDKLTGMTRLGRYIDNPRFYNILLFDGEQGQGSCHGDSGGPAYVTIKDQWYIIGVTNGFDVVLTPEAMERTSDPSFPYRVDCSENQSLYSFIGAHGHWIEETSGINIYKSEVFTEMDRAPKQEHSDLRAWCEARDYGSPSWNLLKILIDKRVDTLPQSQGDAFYNDCSAITEYLSSLKTIYLNYNSTPDAHIDFTAARLLPSLDTINIYEYPIEQVDLKTLSSLNLKELRLINIGLQRINFGENLSVESLYLDKNPLLTLEGIHKIGNLKTLSLSGTTLKDISELESLNLESLSLVGMNSSILLGLEFVNKDLETLDLRDTFIPNAEVLKKFKNLKDLSLTGTSGKVDLTKNKNLESLYLNEFQNGDVQLPHELPFLKDLHFTNSDIDNIDFLKYSPHLEEVTLTYNRIQNLGIFKDCPFPKLRSLNLSVNPILDVSPLAALENLTILRLFRTPLHSKIVPKTEENCPTTTGSYTLKRFCSN